MSDGSPQDPDLTLFPDASEPPPPAPPTVDSDAPLPERMRPRSIDEMVGQDALLGPSGTLRRLLASGRVPSLILHGPPGSGKTTLARLIAAQVDAVFVPFSAVSEGVPRLREIVKEARLRQKANQRTLLFVDEIHRLNKGQQDFLLPYVESGLVTLVGATTEHPAFEVNAALLSRATVVVLDALGDEELRQVLHRALEDTERGLGSADLRLDPAAEELLIRGAAGDARQALGALDTAARLAGGTGEIGRTHVAEALQKPLSQYDTTTAFQMLSAFHKSLRASDGSAALYWGMRMVRAGEDPLVLFRRLVAAAYEDVGLADPRAGYVATQAMQAYERLGPPEGYLPLANAILYVATAPKSNRAYLALKGAMEAAEAHPNAPVPLHLRNASTSLMREWGFGSDYKYAHNYEGAHVDMQCLPDALAEASFYEPSDQGYEVEIRARLKAWGGGE
ncbi:MAG TPA: replication-associated recombination protein A [Longimicrobiaceae bacterium]|nr:replication-associated recombination protein A [Longimicrobiaceae bacterium]